MKKIILLILPFLLLSVFASVYADEFQDGEDAYKRGDYKEAVKWYGLSAKQGFAKAQNNLGVMYDRGQGVAQDYVQAHKWYN